MSDAIETFTDEETGIKAVIVYDQSSGINPRQDYSNMWTLLGFPNNRRSFGDEEIDPSGQTWIDCPKCKGSGESEEIEEDRPGGGYKDCGECGGHGEVEAQGLEQMINAEYPDAVMIVPVQAYEHGLVQYYAGNPTTQHWDTGTAGVAVITQEDLDREYKDDPKAKDKARVMLDNELEIYTDWANGTIYGYYTEDADGDQLEESCWGFIGDLKYVEKEAKDALETEVRAAKMELAEVAYWISREVETVA